MRTMWVKYKYSKFSLVEKRVPEIINGYSVNKDIYKINIIEFVTYALKKGYDWKLFGQPQWEEIEPKKKNKFMKPKKRNV